MHVYNVIASNFSNTLSLAAMDSLTHIVLGACLGKVILPEKMGKKALVLGALAHSIPDIDGISSFFNTASQDLVIHRGLSHSFFMAFLLSMIFSAFFHKDKSGTYHFGKLALCFFVLIGLHDILDTCNNYGTELFAPFLSKRFSFHLLYVVDPLFTIVPLVMAIFLFAKKKYWKNATKIAWAGIIIPIIYIGAVFLSKEKVEANIEKNNLPSTAKLSILTPSPFNSMLWYGIFKDENGDIYTTYRSIWDKPERQNSFQFYPKNPQLLIPFRAHEDVKNLLQFSDSVYVLQKHGDTTEFCIPRFGQILGWEFPHAEFTFYYYLNAGMDNALLIQRGRVKGWNEATKDFYWNRIWGK